MLHKINCFSSSTYNLCSFKSFHFVKLIKTSSPLTFLLLFQHAISMQISLGGWLEGTRVVETIRCSLMSLQMNFNCRKFVWVCSSSYDEENNHKCFICSQSSGKKFTLKFECQVDWRIEKFLWKWQNRKKRNQLMSTLWNKVAKMF